MKKLLICSAVLLQSLCAGIYAQQNFSGGTGTESDPYLVSKLADLQQISGGGNYSGVFFALSGDLDLQGAELEAIGNHFNPFGGTFDGKGFQLSNFKVVGNDGDYGVGLFGSVGEDAVVKNLNISGCTVDGNGNINYMGVLAGSNKGCIENCAVDGNVSGYRYIGGVVGNNTGTIKDCTFLGSVDGQWFVGGIAGYMDYPGSIALSDNKGQITAVKHVGGIVGSANGSTLGTTSVSLCYNTGIVTMTGGDDGSYETMAAAGGIVGYSYLAVVEQCFNKGVVQSDNFNPYVGGVVGNNMDATVADCYNTWTVTGTNGAMVGGVAGINKGEKSVIRNCYNTAKVFSDSYRGEICPAEENVGSVENCYFDVQTASVSGSEGYATLTRDMVSVSGLDGFDAGKWVFADGLYPRLKGLENVPEAKLMASAVICYANEYGDNFDRLSFVTSDFKLGAADGVVWSSDNAAVEIDGGNAVVTRSVDGDVDVSLTAEIEGLRKIIPVVIVADLKGTGTETDPFLIENQNQLRYISSSVASGVTYKGQYIKLVNDVDLGGENNPFSPIGTNDGYYFFEGDFDGNGKTVYNLYINLPNDMYVGLFGRLGETAVVKNLTVGSGYVNGSGNVGAVVGQSAGQVYNCGNYAEVTGTSAVGGVVGVIGYGATGELSNCFNVGNVSSQRGSVGGIAGTVSYISKITHCFNSGKVTDLATGRNPGQAGGIVAYTTVPVEYCYNAGIISDLSDDESRSMAGGIAGRTLGSSDVPVIIGNCINSGAVSTATGLQCNPVAGVVDNEGDEIRGCYYDAQAMPGEYENGLAVATKDFTDASSVSELSSEQWTVCSDSYPVLKCFEGMEVAKFASAALFLADGDDYTSVKNNFSLTGIDGVNWVVSPYYALEAQGTEVTVNRRVEDTECRIGAFLGDAAVKEFSILLKAAESGVCSLSDDAVSVLVSGNNLIIRNAMGAAVSVYDLSGRCVSSFEAGSNAEIVALNVKGVFVVKCGDYVAKIVL